MANRTYGQFGVAPASFNVDLASFEPVEDEGSLFNSPGPYRVSLVGWAETADALAGLLIFDFSHRTPNGVLVASPEIAMNLNCADAAAYERTNIEVIMRAHPGEIVLNAVLVGIASSALISWQIQFEQISQIPCNPFP